MFRSVGSIIFGVAADRYGRKWPFVVNNILFIVLELVRKLSFPCLVVPPPPWHLDVWLADTLY
jgi:MFS family permease